MSRELEAGEFPETLMSALLMHQWLTVTNKPCFNPDRRLGLTVRVALWPSHVHHGTHAPALTRSHSMYTQARYTPTRETEWKHSPYILTTFTNLILLYFWTCVVYVFLFEFPHSSYYCFYKPFKFEYLFMLISKNQFYFLPLKIFIFTSCGFSLLYVCVSCML